MYEVILGMDHDEETGEWRERENDLLVGLHDVTVLDVDTRETMAGTYEQVVQLDTECPTALEQRLNSHPDVISYRMVAA